MFLILFFSFLPIVTPRIPRSLTILERFDHATFEPSHLNYLAQLEETLEEGKIQRSVLLLDRLVIGSRGEWYLTQEGDQPPEEVPYEILLPLFQALGQWAPQFLLWEVYLRVNRWRPFQPPALLDSILLGAAQHGRLDLVRELFEDLPKFVREWKPDPSIDLRGFPGSGRPKMIAYLLEQGAENIGEMIRDLAEDGEEEQVRKLLDEAFDPGLIYLALDGCLRNQQTKLFNRLLVNYPINKEKLAEILIQD